MIKCDKMLTDDFLHKNKIPICSLFIIVGIALTIFCTLSLIHEEDTTGITRTVNDILGDWAYWIMILGIALLVIGSYYIYGYLKLLKEFNGLMDINSKAKFIKNLDRIEELAWRLHPKFEVKVLDKKKEFKVK